MEKEGAIERRRLHCILCFYIIRIYIFIFEDVRRIVIFICHIIFEIFFVYIIIFTPRNTFSLHIVCATPAVLFGSK